METVLEAGDPKKKKKATKKKDGTTLTLILPIFFPKCRKEPDASGDVNAAEKQDATEDEIANSTAEGEVEEEEEEVKKCSCPICEDARAKRRAIRNNIKVYRHTIRQAASVVYLAEIAGADCQIQKTQDGNTEFVVNPQSTPALDQNGDMQENEDGLVIMRPNAKLIIEAAFGKSGKADGYGMRDWIAGQLDVIGCYSECSDQAIKDVMTAWQAKDPNANKASRGWITINSVSKKVPLFENRGFPIRQSHIKLHNHSVSFSMTKNVWFEAKVGKLKDSSRWGAIKKIMVGEWKMSETVRLDIGDPKRKDGKLQSPDMILYISYTRPPRIDVSLDEKKCLEATYVEDRDAFLQFKCWNDGQPTLIDECRNESISAMGALDFVDRKKKLLDVIDQGRKSCGSRSDRKCGCGFRQAHKAISARSMRVSRARENGCRTWNHVWTSRIVNLACRWSCGRIAIYGLPDDLFKRPWQWANFRLDLEYKAKDRGIKLEWPEPPKTKDSKAAEGTK